MMHNIINLEKNFIPRWESFHFSNLFPFLVFQKFYIMCHSCIYISINLYQSIIKNTILNIIEGNEIMSTSIIPNRSQQKKKKIIEASNFKKKSQKYNVTTLTLCHSPNCNLVNFYRV